MSVSLKELRHTLDRCMMSDRFSLRRKLSGLERDNAKMADATQRIAGLTGEINASAARAAERQARLPKPEFPAELPVVARREEIAAAIAAHQVVIICGETGSGKTTQLPKICLELGRGVYGLIGHTQPRRIAARSVAMRIAEELGGEMGGAVGYKVRFTDRIGANTHIKLMTDGILLAEMQANRWLDQYDTIIIDEAHERSLNIDFILGYLKTLLPRRPDLKVIVTSATIDPERFAKHFSNAPIIEVSGRTYPVEVRYRPLVADDDDDRDRDMPQAIIEAVDELARLGPGDVLVFLPGERDIREVAERLRKHHPPHTEILPLFSRLTTQEQDRVFSPHIGRRVVLATNVAETSLTVPGIRYVVDTGFARISRYSARTKVQRLPIEPVSQASANQRAGRCGRVSAGVCIRLYSEQDYLGRPRFTDPEIQRTNLASVILQMLALKLGDIDDFPFVDVPDGRFISDGYKLLQELGAISSARVLTDLGRTLAKLPIDPRLARMVAAAANEGSLVEILVIVSALSVQDPRERPFDAQQAADEKHARFQDPQSDFMALLKLWDYLHEQEKHLSNSKFRALCKNEFISYVRLREWRDIYAQLKEQSAQVELKSNMEPATYEQIHRALLTGLLSNVAFKQEGSEYQGSRGSKIHIFPGSSLAKKPPKWIMAAELMETSRLFARMAARIEPEWIEALAPHLLKRSYSEPHWEKRSGQVGAFEQVSLYGLIIVAKRKINYGPIDPVMSRELFIRHALVEGDFSTDAPFVKHNRDLVAQIEDLEAKSRRQDILVDDQSMFEFYAERLPADIYSAQAFEQWRKRLTSAETKALGVTREHLMRHGAENVTSQQFPATIMCGGVSMPVLYRFEPGHEEDGVTAVVPLLALSHVKAESFEWLVPGLLEAKITELIRSLPKALRRNFVPAPEFGRACADTLTASDASLLATLAAQLKKMTGVDVPLDAWRPQELPTHLRMNFHVVDERGKTLAIGRDLAALRTKLQGQAREVFAELPSHSFDRKGLTRWDFGVLPESLEVKSRGLVVRGFPALTDDGESVSLTLMDTSEKAARATHDGVRRLIVLALPQQIKYLQKNLPNISRLCLLFQAVGSCDQLRQDIIDAVLEQAFFADPAPVRDAATFERRLEQGKGNLVAIANTVCEQVLATLTEYQALKKRLKVSVPPTWIPAMSDIKQHVDSLIFKGFVSATPAQWLPHLPRYLKAVQKRLDKLAVSLSKDREHMLDVASLWQILDERMRKAQAKGQIDPELIRLRWLFEELRVSLWAQDLKTVESVSVKRLQEQLKK